MFISSRLSSCDEDRLVGKREAVPLERNWEKHWFHKPREESATSKKEPSGLANAAGSSCRARDTTSQQREWRRTEK